MHLQLLLEWIVEKDCLHCGISNNVKYALGTHGILLVHANYWTLDWDYRSGFQGWSDDWTANKAWHLHLHGTNWPPASEQGYQNISPSEVAAGW
jgi:hypothetical protein